MIVPFYPLLCKKRTFSYTKACGKLPRITSVCLSCHRQYSEKVLNAPFKKISILGEIYTKIIGGYNLNSPGKMTDDEVNILFEL